MPIYEYVCPSCDTRFEELRPVTRMDDAANCPKGHRSGRRVLSTFAALTRDTEGAVSSVAGGGCGGGCGGDCGGGCGGGCANCACSLN